MSFLVKEEERRRESCWNPSDRWRAIQEIIAWAEQQQPVPRNSVASCLARQRRFMEAAGISGSLR